MLLLQPLLIVSIPLDYDNFEPKKCPDVREMSRLKPRAAAI